MPAPFIVSIVGRSDSGKTTLILKLIPELKRRKYRVAVAKHCPRGFDLDVEGKDSWKFTRAGGDAILLTSPQDLALIRGEEKSFDLRKRLRDYFSDLDIVLMEGYNHLLGVKKIEIVRKGIGRLGCDPKEVVAYVSDTHLRTRKMVFDPSDIPAIADFIEVYGRLGKRKQA